ncbi:kinase-like domain-containing protein [Mycena galericulata]|nr:kinase-like domain-containing protein [Mycena galericulata]
MHSGWTHRWQARSRDLPWELLEVKAKAGIRELIVNLWYDDENCFFVLDLMLGGDLVHLERLGSLDEEVVRFYVAQLSSAVQFLHDGNNIMHRDLKPDNILLDERGGRPFNGLQHCDLTYSITKNPLKWPENAEKKCSRHGMQVLKRLLDRDPARRFGCKPNGEGYQELRRHPWFKAIDWDTLESKAQTPPFAKKANFDASHELEELLLEDNPLKAKTRKANQENFSPEMRQMEEQYVSIKMQRRSYFPHNRLIFTATASSSGVASSQPGIPANDLRVENGVTINGSSLDLQNCDRMIMTEKDYQ